MRGSVVRGGSDANRRAPLSFLPAGCTQLVRVPPKLHLAQHVYTLPPRNLIFLRAKVAPETKGVLQVELYLAAETRGF